VVSLVGVDVLELVAGAGEQGAGQSAWGREQGELTYVSAGFHLEDTCVAEPFMWASG